MLAIELIREESVLAFNDLIEAIDGLDEARSWWCMAAAGDEYLHTDGSVHGIVLHVAGCKMMYGSIGFCNTEIRWRELAERMEKFEPNWEAAVSFLKEAHEYWMKSWGHLTSEQLSMDVPTNSGKMMPAWRLIRLMHHHDSYHAGQIAMLRFAAKPTSEKPPSAAEDIRKYCADSAAW